MSITKSFWPLPGGARNYFKTLWGILNYIHQETGEIKVVREWFIEEFNLSSQDSTTNYLDVVKKLGFIKSEKNKFILTESGYSLISRKDPNLVLTALIKRILGFNEILNVISEKQPIDKKSIYEIVNTKLKAEWKTDAQINWRLNWLLSLDIIDVTARKFYLTEMGNEALTELRQEKEIKYVRNDRIKKEKKDIITHNELEDKLKYIGEFFEFTAIKRPKINEMLPIDRQLRKSNKELDGLWIKKIPMGGKIYYPIEVQLDGNISDTIDRLETVSDFAQKAVIIIEEDKEELFLERLNAKRSKLLDKVVILRPDDVNKIQAATNALKSFFIDLFKQ